MDGGIRVKARRKTLTRGKQLKKNNRKLRWVSAFCVLLQQLCSAGLHDMWSGMWVHRLGLESCLSKYKAERRLTYVCLLRANTWVHLHGVARLICFLCNMRETTTYSGTVKIDVSPWSGLEVQVSIVWGYYFDTQHACCRNKLSVLVGNSLRWLLASKLPCGSFRLSVLKLSYSR